MSSEKIFQLYVRFPQEPVHIRTNNRAYFLFLKEYFRAAVCEEGPARIVINAMWREKRWGKERGDFPSRPQMCRIGGNTFEAPGRAETLIKINRRWKTWLRFFRDGTDFRYDADIKLNGKEDFWKYKILRKSQEEYFYQITYPVLYYPLFWALENLRGQYLLHASGISFAQGGGVIFCGLEGIGKTSLVLSLLGQGSAFLSDNLLFFDRENMFPCYETVRVHGDGEQHLWQEHFERLETFRSCKDFYVPRQPASSCTAKPQAMIFPQFGPEFSVTEIDSLAAARRAVNLSFSASELGQYLQYRNFYNIVDAGHVPETAQFDALCALLKGKKCFIVTMPKGDGLRINVGRMKDVLRQAGFTL